MEPEYVDLGLSVKWATFNIGATTPEEYGDYFAWGKTEPKDEYSWATYKWCNGTSSTITKYNANDGKTVLAPQDDAATVNWGGAWRMPTKAEQDELHTKCKWVWTTQNGVNGYKVVGPNGNSIFLPAAGYVGGSSLGNVGSRGGYWSSSLYTSNPSLAYVVDFNSSGVYRSYYSRSGGHSVRPIYHKNNPTN